MKKSWVTKTSGWCHGKTCSQKLGRQPITVVWLASLAQAGNIGTAAPMAFFPFSGWKIGRVSFDGRKQFRSAFSLDQIFHWQCGIILFASRTAASAVAYASLINAGQVCTSSERIYVHESHFGQFSEELADFVGNLRLGNGLDPQTDIGPMIRNQFRKKVEGQLAEALETGARVLVGGKRPSDLHHGFFLEPAVLVNVNHDMPIMREETFGPVLPIMPYKTFDEAIALANDTPYGLGASLMTGDARLVKRFYEEVKAGTIWINDPLTDNFAGPFGGMKMTGGGRELGQEGLDEFYEIKHVHWDVEGKLKEYWYPYGR